MQYHSVANLFPMMSDDEYAALVADIHQHGQREPIWVYDNQIIDGRNRWQACRDLGIAPITREWNGDGSLVTFVVSLNLQRRHLTSSQKAVIALDVEKALGEEAHKKEQERKSTYQIFDKSDNQPTLDLFETPIEPKPTHTPVVPIHAAKQAAAIVGSNRQYVFDAKKLSQAAPDLIEKVRSGAITIPEAKREVKERVKVQARENRIANPPAIVPEAVTVEHGDSIAHIRANSIDTIVTDPPYGISHYGGVTKVGDQIVTANFDGDDSWDSIDPAEFLDTMYGWAEEWERVLKPGGSVIAFTDRALVSHLWDIMKRVGLKPKQIITWVKTNPSPAGLSRKNLISATEAMVWAVAPGAPYVFNEVDGWDRRNVIVTPIIGGLERVDHPTQKPIAVLSKLIQLTSNPGDLILDPFGGSGSTAVAALQLGRRAHLIEQNINYVRLAQERLAATNQEQAA